MAGDETNNNNSIVGATFTDESASSIPSTPRLTYTRPDYQLNIINQDTGEFRQGLRATVSDLARIDDHAWGDFIESFNHFRSLNLDNFREGFGEIGIATIKGIVGTGVELVDRQFYDYDNQNVTIGSLRMPEIPRNNLNGSSDPHDYFASGDVALRDLGLSNAGDWRIGIGWSRPEYLSFSNAGAHNNIEDAYSVILSRRFGGNDRGGGGRGSND